MFRIGEFLEAARFASSQIAEDQDGPSVTAQGGISDPTSCHIRTCFAFSIPKHLHCASHYDNRSYSGCRAPARRQKGGAMKDPFVYCVAVLLGIFGAMAAKAQDVSQADKDRALVYLKSTEKGVLDATAGLSYAQWNFKPGPDRWSVAEVMEHLAAAEDLFRSAAQRGMRTTVGPARDPAEFKKIDDAITTNVPDRTSKAQAPEPLIPTNRFGSPAAAQKHFLERRTTTE